ncbi:LysM peptidoglycan-binding domain-containing protein [Mammaliicoccus sciuri]|uniref:LysM peptidoglycan-binding domain-containing protein n=1 Tax=Mammaliicoccus sciuri TaxID=1296 RepID=UPI002DBE8322|nr:LysM peptidoglycan-binding domain-containing protein [Mammaliicoccus sciuri]MEB7784224.1 LysM peptidoglycan-binding domain-containing protein [Mammaliicoccus sciuri]
MRYKNHLIGVLSSALLLLNLGQVEASENGMNTNQVQENKQTSKPIDFKKAQQMSPSELKSQLTPQDLLLHNKVSDHQENTSQYSARRTYQDVNSYISKNSIKPSKIVKDSRINTLPKYNYKSSKFIGVVIHETANPNSTIEGEVNYMYNNYFNAFVHAYASGNKIIQTAPSNYLAWGAGANANPYFYQIELVRAHSFDEFARSVNNQAYLTAQMLKQNGLKPSLADNNQGSGTIISHNAISRYWGGTDHTDPVGYFNQWGYNMNQFYELVNKHFKANSGSNNNNATPIKGDSYKVVKGDTLYSVSKRSGKSVTNIKKWNKLKSDTLKIGQTLKLKAPATNTGNTTTIKGNTYKVVKGDTLYSISKRSGKSVTNIKKWNYMKNDSIKVNQIVYLKKTHKVAKKDTLYSISKKYKTSVEKIKKDNNLKNNTIKVGQILLV